MSSMDEINVLNVVACHSNISTSRILGKERTRTVVRARTLAALCFRHLGYSYPEIGHALRRHHTTVRHLITKADEDAHSYAERCLKTIKETSYLLRYLPPTPFNTSLTWVVTDPRTDQEVMLPRGSSDFLSAVLLSEAADE